MSYLLVNTITAAGTVTVSADRLSEHFALAPVVVDTGHGQVLSTDAWTLIHLASGLPFMRLTQHQHGETACLDRTAVVRFAQWLETINGWATVDTVHGFTGIEMNDRQLELFRAVLANPNTAHARIDEYEAATTPLRPSAPEPTIMHISRTDRLRRRGVPDPRLQFVPPLRSAGRW